MNKTGIRVITAICFAVSLAVRIRNFINFQGYQQESFLYLLLVLLPILASAAIVAGALIGKPAVIGIGAAVILIYNIASVSSLWSHFATMPSAMRSQQLKILIMNTLSLFEYLLLALGCFIKRHRLGLCIAAAAMRLIVYAARMVLGLSTFASAIVLLSNAGWIAGALLTGIFMSGRLPDSAKSDPLLNN